MAGLPARRFGVGEVAAGAGARVWMAAGPP
jgi:hypothetical protein